MKIKEIIGEIVPPGSESQSDLENISDASIEIDDSESWRDAADLGENSQNNPTICNY